MGVDRDARTWPLLLNSLQKQVGTELFEGPRTDPLHLAELLNLFERAVLITEGNDPPGQCRTDSRQFVKLFDGRGIEIKGDNGRSQRSGSAPGNRGRIVGWANRRYDAENQQE
jgi:hypothetical protein